MKNILILEPDTVLGKAYSQALDQAGYKATVVRNAQQAINICDKKIFDCLVMEIQLQAHGGFEFLYEFRSYKDWLQVPVIINSMVPLHILKPYNNSLSQLGVIKCLYKPATNLSTFIKEITVATPILV